MNPICFLSLLTAMLGMAMGGGNPLNHAEPFDPTNSLKPGIYAPPGGFDGVANYDELVKALVDSVLLLIGGHHLSVDENITIPPNNFTRSLSGTQISLDSEASPTRHDAYDPRAYSGSSSIEMKWNFFKQLYEKQAGIPRDAVNFALDVLAQNMLELVVVSIKNNPNFFLSPTHIAFGPSTAHMCIPNLFANHSTEHWLTSLLNREGGSRHSFHAQTMTLCSLQLRLSPI
ncbi:Chloroperoxidase [Macrophomina phaseolina MS6]|uniref:Chloroperoxidase n=1 Tax=Macrophomina phaseolina (strain MS6) TaxID=1126212 RepID=K2SLW4_MACPH|nr:Chloroperoxidase [Macrophomina phaseolina MS6]